MKYSKLMEVAMKAQRRIEALDLPVYVRVGGGSIYKEGYIILTAIETDKIQHFETVEEFKRTYIDKAKKLVEPKYKPLKGLCVNKLNTVVYYKKADGVYVYCTIKSISDKGVGVIDSELSTWDNDIIYRPIESIYVKE